MSNKKTSDKNSYNVSGSKSTGKRNNTQVWGQNKTDRNKQEKR